MTIETTYGDRLHKPLQPSIEGLYQVIEDSHRRGGKLIIPTFALERAQELLYFLRDGTEQGRLSGRLQVFLDSPMAISATQTFERHPEANGAAVAAMFQADRDELLAWHRQVAPERIFLVHGEEAIMQQFARQLGGGAVDMPALGEAVALSRAHFTRDARKCSQLLERRPRAPSKKACLPPSAALHSAQRFGSRGGAPFADRACSARSDPFGARDKKETAGS